MEAQRANKLKSNKLKAKLKTSDYFKQIKSLLKIRKNEIFNTVPQSHQEIVSQHHSSLPDDAIAVNVVNLEDEEIIESLGVTYEEAFNKIKRKESAKELNQVRKLHKPKVNQALSFLNKPESRLSNEEKQLKRLEVCCTIDILKLQTEEENEGIWDSPTYIIKMIKSSVLRRDWSNVSQLLLMMLRRHKMYLPYVKQVTLINLLMNPVDPDGNVLEEFLQLCFSTVAKNTGSNEFDIWYRQNE